MNYVKKRTILNLLLCLCAAVIIAGCALSAESNLEWIDVNAYSLSTNPLPEFNAGWEASGHLSVAKDRDGFVHIDGIAYRSSGDTGSGMQLLRLQEEYRPGVTLEIPVVLRNVAGTYSSGYVRIDILGYIHGYEFGSAGYCYVYFSDIVFYGEN